MVEKPLFTTTYFECPWCDPKPVTIETDNNNDNEYPYWLDRQHDMVESDYYEPCTTTNNKNTHRYISGNGYCSCGGKEAPLPKMPKMDHGNYFIVNGMKVEGAAIRVHGTVHGRFGSSQPNPMTLPKDEDSFTFNNVFKGRFLNGDE